MAGAEEVVEAIERAAGRRLRGLVLNEKGYERLRATGLDEVHFAFASTETFNQRNQNASVAESVAAAERIVARAHADGLRATVTIGVVVRLPVRGRRRPGPRCSSSPRRLAGAGADEIVLADTIGVGVPRQVRTARRRRRRARGADRRPPAQHAEHRATRTPTRRSRRARPCSTPRSAASAAVRSRRGRRATSPPRISSTCSTGRGSRPGIDLDALIGVAEWLEDVLERQLPGQVYRAGTFAPVAGGRP